MDYQKQPLSALLEMLDLMDTRDKSQLIKALIQGCSEFEIQVKKFVHSAEINSVINLLSENTDTIPADQM